MSPHDDNDKELTCLLFALWFPQQKSGTPLTPVPMDLTLRVMGDKSPKATHKHAVQKQVKVDAARQEKNKAVVARQIPKTKK